MDKPLPQEGAKKGIKACPKKMDFNKQEAEKILPEKKRGVFHNHSFEFFSANKVVK